MAVATSPFCTSSDVAPYMPIWLKGRGDYEDGVTNMPKTNVDIYITNVSAQIMARFRRAGYVTPLVDLEGITWPSDQTTFLNVLCVMGTCSIISSPLVSNPSAKTGDPSLFKSVYDDGLKEIFDTEESVAGPFYGCQYRGMSYAERSVGVPAIPTTSYLLEMNDPAAHTGFRYWTDKSQEMQDYMESLLPLHNYAYSLNDLNKGPYV